MSLGTHIVHKLMNEQNLTDEEALVVARWILWLQLSEEY
jgi:hypothetical protein